MKCLLYREKIEVFKNRKIDEGRRYFRLWVLESGQTALFTQ